MSKADQYIVRLKKLPPAPTVVTELLRHFDDPDHDLDRIVQLISLEPSLTVEVLKLCNSATFAGAEPIADVFSAVSRLGFYEVYCVVAGLMGSRVVAVTDEAGGINRTALWRHSVMTAVGAGTLARRLEEPEAVAFTAGLLHDIGKTVLSTVEPEIYRAILEASGAHGSRLVLAEEARLGASHAEIGGRLMSRWTLPSPVVAAVMSHHQSPAVASRNERLAAIVQVANLLAAGDAIALPQGDPTGHEQQSLQLTNLTLEDLPSLIEEINQALERTQSLLSLGT
jgi:putative nucleotidyltransferase with HDIG domain